MIGGVAVGTAMNKLRDWTGEPGVRQIKVPLATDPTGGCDGGKICGVESRSIFAISFSICALNSFDARLKSLSAFPSCRPISGIFFGPKMIRARRKRNTISEKPRFMLP